MYQMTPFTIKEVIRFESIQKENKRKTETVSRGIVYTKAMKSNPTISVSIDTRCQLISNSEFYTEKNNWSN